LAEVEIDKRVLEEMKEPLIHIMRNCVDHGLETPEERLQLGKNPRATIVLVTALDTREDRERGIDVGADAYLVKSSFDQSNLLEAVRRLA
jgi:DNA-binding NarL/FixJ family response regulator